jgi:hypothetical protein
MAAAATGCAPVGQGDPCTPEAIPGNGFVANEVYVETSSVQCRTRVCMVYHLQGNPECTTGITDNCGAAPGPTNQCVISDGHGGSTNLCVVVDNPDEVQIDPNSPDRVFCTCRCSATGNTSLPLCQCTDGFRCIPDSDPGGGYCVPNDLAINAGICANDAECSGIGTTHTCDVTHHCR